MMHMSYRRKFLNCNKKFSYYNKRFNLGQSNGMYFSTITIKAYNKKTN